MRADWQEAITRAQAHSPFLARALDDMPGLRDLLLAGEGDAALAAAKGAGEGIEDVGVALRREKRALALALAIGDLAGAFTLERVTATLSEFADRALDAAIAEAIRHRTPDAEPQGFAAIALGKHGSRELNYSSDIDPILIYDPHALPRRERDEPAEAAQRIARRVVETLGRVTADGYVFRVDLRLRPAAEVTPPALPIDGAISHYESSALTWERAAFMRARAAAGDTALGARFLDAIRPFIWRSSLDFGAIDEIRRLTARIRADQGGPAQPGPGYNVKRGLGGIREIEFFVQTHQLIHAGRDPSLRDPRILPALEALAVAGHVDGHSARIMGEAYVALRTAEHRLQMVQDRQTHTLPSGAEELANVARLAGFAGAQEWCAHLHEHTERVARIYGELIDGEDDAAPSLGEALAASGLADTGALSARIEKWQDGRYQALRSTAAQTAFRAVLPGLLEALGQAPDPQTALARFETLLQRLPSAINLFRLLEARPALADQLMRILTLAPPLADELSRRPELLDALIDKGAFALPGSVGQLAQRMRSPPDADYEAQLERLRRTVGEQRFMLGVQLIEAAQDPLDVAAGLGRVAEAALVVATEAAEAEYATRHGRFAERELLVLGLGRLGGGSLTYASDLDIVYLFTGSLDGESDGAKPLGPTLYFNRLAQRAGAALSVPTAQGALYEVDTRLRPQGKQGPLAASLESFARYQRDDAWTWEHMALCRARPVYGSDARRAELAGLVRVILCRPRDADGLRKDVLAMRAEMAEHKPPRGPLDVKLLRGGLVDCEFLVHFLQLRDAAAFKPALHDAIAELEGAGTVTSSLSRAHDFLTRVLVCGRLLAPDGVAAHPAAMLALARACGEGDGDALLDRIAGARRDIAREWHDIFGQTLELTP